MRRVKEKIARETVSAANSFTRPPRKTRQFAQPTLHVDGDHERDAACRSLWFGTSLLSSPVHPLPARVRAIGGSVAAASLAPDDGLATWRVLRVGSLDPALHGTFGVGRLGSLFRSRSDFIPSRMCTGATIPSGLRLTRKSCVTIELHSRGNRIFRDLHSTPTCLPSAVAGAISACVIDSIRPNRSPGRRQVDYA